MKYLLYTLFISSLLSQVLEKQNKLLWDGTDWNSIERKADVSEKSVYRIKSAYLNGLLDGRLYYYLKAFNFRKTRLEALYRIVFYFRTNDKFKEGFAYGMLGINTHFPKDLVFVEEDIHKYKFIDELSICAYYCEFHILSYKLTKQILDEKHYPEQEYKRISGNLKFSSDKLIS